MERVTKVKVLFLVLVYVFNFELCEFSAAILQKGLLCFLSCFTVFIVVFCFVCDFVDSKRLETFLKVKQKRLTFGHAIF